MKKRSVFCLLLALVMLFACIPVSAAYRPADFANWKNLTDKEADALLLGNQESYILFFYRDTCGNSKSSLKKCIPYAVENGLTLCGINETEYPNWQTWYKRLPSGPSTFGFPIIYAYNAKEDLFAWRDGKLNAEEFHAFLAEAKMQPAQPKFTDVPRSSRYFAAVEALCEKGILSGYTDGTFKPENSITRTEAAAVTVRAAGLDQSTASSIFTDVADDFWGRGYIMAANENGITIDELLQAGVRCGVIWQDGRPFHGACHIRMNLALPTSLLREAMERLDRYVFSKGKEKDHA